MEEFVTRSAALADLYILLKFEQGVITAGRPYDPTIRKEPIHYYDLRYLILREDAEARWSNIRMNLLAQVTP